MVGRAVAGDLEELCEVLARNHEGERPEGLPFLDDRVQVVAHAWGGGVRDDASVAERAWSELHPAAAHRLDLAGADQGHDLPD